MKNLSLSLFSVIVLMGTNTAMASCKLNVNGTVNTDDYSTKIDVIDMQKSINDSLDYEVSSNKEDSSNQMQYTITMHSSGNAAEVHVNYTFNEGKTKTTLISDTTVTSTFESRLDNQVVSYIKSLVPNCSK